jgi:two-component system chemotaxis response regulator CheB
MNQKARLLLVDDSRTALLGLRKLLTPSGFDIGAEATTGAEAVEQSRRHRPDLVTMDVFLGGDDGVTATRAILHEAPTRVVLVTGLDRDRGNLAFRALEAGALDVLRKPPFDESEASAHVRRRFIQALASLAGVPLLRRGQTPRPARPSAIDTRFTRGHEGHPMVVLGASTGGPSVLRRILEDLPRPFGAPIVVVQHIERGYGSGLAEWLASTTGHPARQVTAPMRLVSGMVHLAPDDAHLHWLPGETVAPAPGKPRNFVMPSIDVFLESIPGSRAAGTFAAILTGMGNDGAEGLARLRAAGAYTLAQSTDSCVVPTMPQEALARGGASAMLPPELIARAAVNFVTAGADSREPTPRFPDRPAKYRTRSS